jgi:hypothetical protein
MTAIVSGSFSAQRHHHHHHHQPKLDKITLIVVVARQIKNKKFGVN